MISFQEQFKIPKLKVEERKKREREMGEGSHKLYTISLCILNLTRFYSCDSDETDIERGAARNDPRSGESRWGTWRDRKRQADSPERRSSEDKKRRQAETDEQRLLMKKEHRRRIEVQAQAEDQMRRLQEMEQQQQQAVQLAQQQIEQQLQQQAAAALAASQLLDPSYASYFDPNFPLAPHEQAGEWVSHGARMTVDGVHVLASCRSLSRSSSPHAAVVGRQCGRIRTVRKRQPCVDARRAAAPRSGACRLPPLR